MISNWISERTNEGSSHQGAIVVAAAVAVLFFAVPLTKVILWGALAWGVWSIFKKG
ncbi:MAG: hypothetical protein QGH83_12825 [Candidatus Pacebacteria bacterium]|jgi:uncharacterized membrane protein YozB (DUF420 family)|nr:hypothetical protein [Candidatus Paceibacterota bacterium]|tara:strand:+ start:409 stop:576 length:168 start_codon:yes stop_codon:yes gene_type:complete